VGKSHVLPPASEEFVKPRKEAQEPETASFVLFHRKFNAKASPQIGQHMFCRETGKMAVEVPSLH